MAIIWTKHAIERNKERQVTAAWVESTINNPDQSFPENEGRTKFIKKFEEQTVSVITAIASEGGYLVLSAWIDPPNPGTIDYKNEQFEKKMKIAGNLRRFLFTFLRQIGL